MNWFETQLEQRAKNDGEELSDTVIELAQTVISSDDLRLINSERISEMAIDEMLHCFRKNPVKYPYNVRSFGEKLSYAASSHGIMYRTVILKGDWYKDAFGVMIAVIERDSLPVTLIPKGISGYRYFDTRLKKYVKITKKNCGMFKKQAYVFYKPLPEGTVTPPKLLRYMLNYVSFPETAMMLFVTVLAISMALMIPDLTANLFSKTIAWGNNKIIYAIGAMMISATLAGHFFKQARSLLTRRFTTRLSTGVQTASMMRVLSFPMNFFKKYSAGDLASRLDLLQPMCEITVSFVLSTVIFLVYSILNILRWIGRPEPFRVNLVLTVFIIILYVWSLRRQAKFNIRKFEADTEVNGITYEIITGIQKIKLTGTEKRFFSRWGRAYSESARLNYSPPESLVLLKTLPVLITIAESVFLYLSLSGYFKYSEITTAEFLSCVIWLSIFLGSVTSWFSEIPVTAMATPIANLLKPIFETLPEGEAGKLAVTNFREGIDFSGVSFRYDEGSPYVLKNFDLHINNGEYIAIVGKTGSGKSTIMRLLIGFEKVCKGAVYINGVDIDNIDHKALRRQIGIVQQDARLFQGDILSNIRLSAPNASWKDVWKAAETAGIADEIRKMPMGMHTIISEGGKGVSGGQRQRIVIARSIISNPKILLLDEATSALDNITQSKVAKALDSLNCTRIVIAHRLSTIKRCDRIIVLKDGTIAETGSYDELIAKKGYFAELVEKQQIE